VQSIPWSAAPSSTALLLVTSAFVTPIVMRGIAAKPSGMRDAAVLKATGYTQERKTAQAGAFEQGCVSDSRDQTSWKPKARKLF